MIILKRIFIFTIYAFEVRGQTKVDIYSKNLIGKRIINGNKTAANDYPFLVQIRNPRTKENFCAGTLYNKNYVISAAHCFESYYKARIVKAEFGINVYNRSVLGKNTVYVKAQSAIMHPEYTNKYNDIIIIKLQPYDTNIIKEHHLELSSAESFTESSVIGWGLNQTENGQQSDIPYSATCILKNNSTVCKSYKNIKSMYCCTPDYSVKPSSGYRSDSGGPYIVKENKKTHLIGIASHGQPGISALMTSVYYFKDFIESSIKELDSKKELEYEDSKKCFQRDYITEKRICIPYQYQNTQFSHYINFNDTLVSRDILCHCIDGQNLDKNNSTKYELSLKYIYRLDFNVEDQAEKFPQFHEKDIEISLFPYDQPEAKLELRSNRKYEFVNLYEILGRIHQISQQK